MRIVFVLPNFLPVKIGGTEIATYYTAKELAKRGHEIYVLTSHFKSLTFYEQMDGFEVIRIPWITNYLFDTELRFLGYHEFIINGIKVLKKLKPNIIHSQGFFASIFAFLAKRTIGINYCVGVRGSDINLNFPFKGILLKRIFADAKAIIVLSSEMKEKVYRYVRGKEVYVVPSGIDKSLFSGSDMKGKLYEEKRRIIFVGNLRKVKGVHYLLASFALVKKCSKNPVELMIIGDGPLKEQLVALAERLGIKDSVLFLGRKKHEEIPLYMAKAHLMVLSSIYEGLPNVLLEALAMGLPIVATRVGGVPDIVEEGVNGFIVAPGDYKMMAEKICLLLNNENMLLEFSKNSLKISEKFSWESLAARLEEIYKTILI